MIRKLATIFLNQIKVPQQQLRRNIQSTGVLYEKSKKEEKPAEEAPPKPPPLILVEKDGPITLIGINRPKQRNAVNAQAAQEICDAFTEYENDDKSTVAVLYGIGGSFCSGYDVHELGTAEEKISTDLLMVAEGSVGPTRRHIKKPVVCAINGYCVANGLELALMCDLRVMEECSILGFFNRRFGVPVIDGGTVRLPAMIGFSRAMDLILTGRQICAKEALDIGIANRIVATGTAFGQAVNLANSIAKFPQAALVHDRNSLYENAFGGHNFNNAIQNEIMYTSQEVINQLTEGIKAFNAGNMRSGKTADVKEKSMADWEKSEVVMEKEAKEKASPEEATKKE